MPPALTQSIPPAFFATKPGSGRSQKWRRRVRAAHWEHTVTGTRLILALTLALGLSSPHARIRRWGRSLQPQVEKRPRAGPSTGGNRPLRVERQEARHGGRGPGGGGSARPRRRRAHAHCSSPEGRLGTGAGVRGRGSRPLQRGLSAGRCDARGSGGIRPLTSRPRRGAASAVGIPPHRLSQRQGRGWVRRADGGTAHRAALPADRDDRCRAAQRPP